MYLENCIHVNLIKVNQISLIQTLKRKIGRHRFSLWEQTKINNENQKTASPTLGWWAKANLVRTRIGTLNECVSRSLVRRWRKNVFYCLAIKLKTFLVPMRLGETPVPIPNTTVKTQSADGTALETVWESRWLPAPNLIRNGQSAYQV